MKHLKNIVNGMGFMMPTSYFQKIKQGVLQHLSRNELMALVLSLYFSVFLHGKFWSALLQTQADHALFDQWLFTFAVGLAITCFQAALITLFLWLRSFAKTMAIIWILIASLSHYFINQYGVHFDTSMLKNVLATDTAEALDLMSWGLWVQTLLYAAPLIAWVLYIDLPPRSLRSQALQKIFVLFALLIISVISVASCFKTFASTMRTHKEIRFLIVPSSPFIAFVKALQKSPSHDIADRQLLDPQAYRKPSSSSSSSSALLTIVLVGETARAQNWQLSGYAQATTPELAKLSKKELFNFPYAKSCGTNTEVSVPCMFSSKGRDDYDESFIAQSESILHLMNRVGVDITWIDNQSGCKGVCTGLKTLDLRKENDSTSTDEVLVKAMSSAISRSPKDQVIVLHMIGNHGPAYFKRYPASFEHFQPACKNNDLSRCTQAEIINAYNNALRYTDHVIVSAIQKLRTINDRSVALVYVSDHGESLGEKGIYLHGLPYSIAPQEQTHVPFLFFLPEKTQKKQGLNTACLMQKTTQPTQHDLLAHTLLGMYQVQTKVYKKSFDFFQSCL